MISRRKHFHMMCIMAGISVSAILLFGAAFHPGSATAQVSTDITGGQQSGATSGQTFAIQNTSRSAPDPTPGHEEFHQAVIALPIREDGKIYRGIMTFSASQPVEIVVLHPFNQTNNATGTISLTREDENTAITLMHAGEGVLFDSTSFAGSSLVFHSRSPANFTVSYTIVGDLVSPTSLPPDAR
jgi:hypothetical protein